MLCLRSRSDRRDEGWLSQRQLAIVRQTFDVNTFSFMSLATAALPVLEATGGAIVVVSSMAGKMGLPAVAAYSSSKHALHGFFDSLRHDLANSRSNVSITTAILGSIDTESAKKGTTLPDGSPGPALYCAVIVKTVDAHTRSKTGINELLRD